MLSYSYIKQLTGLYCNLIRFSFNFINKKGVSIETAPASLSGRASESP